MKKEVEAIPYEKELSIIDRLPIVSGLKKAVEQRREEQRQEQACEVFLELGRLSTQQ